MQIDALLELLEDVHAAGSGWSALCPAHEDRSPSLSIGEGEEGILLNCQAGCSTERVLETLNLTWRDLFYNAVNFAEPEATYDYTDEQGTVLFQAVRYPGKKFRQRHQDPETGEWVWNLDGVRRVLYRLPELLEAVRNGQTIYVCEGEKDAEALIARGKMATCNPMGAGKWRPEYAQHLSGANVIVVADRDEPGRNHAETVKQSLQGIARSVHVVQAKSGKDAHDHLDAGHAIEEFQPLKQRVRRGIITSRELADQGEEDLNLTSSDIPGYQLVEAIPLVFRQGRMYAVGAYQGDGKSRFALQGTRKLAEEGKRGAYWSLEMPERDLRNALLTHKGIPLALLEEPWRLRVNAEMYQLYLDGLEEIKSWNVDFICKSTVSAEEIAQTAMDREHEFIVVDHLHRMPMRDRQQFGGEVLALTNIALEQNIMLVLLCQLRKQTRGRGDMEVYPIPTLPDFRETSQIADDASMALAIWRQRDDSGLRYTGATQIIVLKNRHTTGSNDAAGRFFFPSFDTTRQMFTSGPAPGAVTETADPAAVFWP